VAVREAPRLTGVVAIVQARMRSTRLPGKVLEDLAGEPMVAHVVTRARAATLVNEVVVATSDRPADDAVVALCAARGWASFRGSEEDVLDRYYRGAQAYDAAHVVRVTADCPLLCPVQLDRVLVLHLESGADYTHNITVWGSEMPLGTGAEVFTAAALATSWRDGHEPHHREHVDEYVGEHPELFRIERVLAPPGLRRPGLRLTVDTPEDLELVREVYVRLKRPGDIIDLVDVVRLFDEEPKLAAINADVRQKTI
jgi:spore coat polysaccharide biosynthesis protein SpsF